MCDVWLKWFAWYPIEIDGNRVWLKWVERMEKIDIGHSSPAAIFTDTYYRLCNKSGETVSVPL